MTSPIPFDQQYFYERDRNLKFQFSICMIVFALLAVHGLIFQHIPNYIRSKRTTESLQHKKYFKYLKAVELWTNCFEVTIFGKKYYYQPSVLLIGLVHIGISTAFCLIQTKDLNYQVYFYIVAKRILRVATGNLVPILFMVAKNDLFTFISGLQHDRLTFIHKWLARLMWAMITIHTGMTIYYWLNLNFIVMIEIPPQIFGMIAYGCFFILTFGSLKFIRSWAFDFFLIEHRVANFIMLLMMFFHNPGNKAVVLIAVHGLVVDRILTRVFSLIHKFKSPTKLLSEFEILDDGTMFVTIPIRDIEEEHPKKWFKRFLPNCREWKAGQHIFLNVSKVKYFQMHPFTICSLSESGNMKLLIRKQQGFTKLLMNKIIKLQAEKSIKREEGEEAGEDTVDIIQDEEFSICSDGKNPIISMKAAISGPYGGQYHNLLKFDYVSFLAAGSGGAFILPVALDLLNKIKQRDEVRDFLHRPERASIHIVWIIQQEDNINWFRELIELLKEYVQNGKAKLDIYITQGQSSSQIEVLDASIDESADNKEMTSYQSTDSVTSDSSLIHSNRQRPQVKDLINESAEVLAMEKDNYKSYAVLGCGPESFTNSIKGECQIKRKELQHDVYCYTEAF